MGSLLVVVLVVALVAIIYLLYAHGYAQRQRALSNAVDTLTDPEMKFVSNALQRLSDGVGALGNGVGAAVSDTKERAEEVMDVGFDALQDVKDRIVMRVSRVRGTPKGAEGMKYFPDVNTRLWKRYYYTFPYNYKTQGAWPPGMFSRLRYWSPGYYTGSGWQFELRPGIEQKYWQRNRWIRSNGDYYLIRNGEDYVHDAADYSNPAFAFL